MAKTAAYGINSVTLATPGANGAYPTSWSGDGSFAFKAIVRDSLQFNDSAASDNDIEVEDSDDIYASLPGGTPTKGFTMDTYDLSAEAYAALQQFTTSGAWNVAPVKTDDLIKAVQIVTRAFDDFPSKTFQWAKMKIKVTRAGTIGKGGFPNFHLEFRELSNTDGFGNPISGHRWTTTPVAPEMASSAGNPFTTSTNVTLTTPTENATIYYTQDGSNPTTASTQYSTAIALSATKTIKAIAVLDGVVSPVTSVTFTKSGS